VNRSSNETVAAARAHWLTELADAVERAQRLSWTLGIEGGNAEAKELYARLEWVRTEIESLRLSGWGDMRQEFTQEWINDLLVAGGLLNAPRAD
jgi:hypothetical protein